MRSLSSIIKSSRVHIGQVYEIPADVFVSHKLKICIPEAQEEEKVEEDQSTLRESADQLILEAEAEAERILQDAHNQADAIMQQAQQEVQLLHDTTAKQGYEEGYQQGYHESQEKANAILDEAAQVLSAAKKERLQLLDSVEPEVIKLSLSIAKKILNNTVKVSPEYIVEMIRKGMGKSIGEEGIYIRVSDEDYKFVVEHKNELYKISSGVDKIEIKKDLSLDKTQCIIETPFGNIDCSLDTQFEGIAKEFKKILGNE